LSKIRSQGDENSNRFPKKTMTRKGEGHEDQKRDELSGGRGQEGGAAQKKKSR